MKAQMGMTPGISRLVDAIAFAEGWFVAESRPRRNNNPGDLTIDVSGKAIGRDGPYVIYATEFDGWEALTQQVQKMMTGRSRYYRANMTIAQIAKIWTSTDQEAWALNVATRLGVSIDTMISNL